MTSHSLFLSVLVMALITYLIRMLPLTLFRKKIKNPYIRSFLAYVPYAVLGAMTFPDALYATGNLISAGCGLFVAIVLSLKGKNLLMVSLWACGTVFIVERLVILFS